ncbi:type IV secretory system conjugative DNA transfer family protein [Streptomyces hypolithicus]
MTHSEQRQGRPDRQGTERGIPDSLVIGLLAFLLGLTVMAWLAAGLAGLFAHGAWPDGVTFARTPLALRRLLGAPQDIAAAWPDTPPEQLSGYGLFWGLLIGELMVLFVLTIFVTGVLARVKAQRTRARGAAWVKRAQHTAGSTSSYVDNQSAVPGNGAFPHPGTLPAPQNAVPGYGAFPHPGTLPAPQSGVPGNSAFPSAGAFPGRADDGTGFASPTGVPAAAGPAAPPEEWPTREPAPLPGTAGLSSLVASPAVPAPRSRAPRFVYGGPQTRRPTAIQAILDAEGAALVVTSDPTLWAETKDARAKLGPVLVYDPGHLCDTPARIHWSPTTGCAQPDTAAARAAALLAPVRPQSRLDAATADTAETLLSSWLHAAAVDGRPFRQVHRWALGNSAQEAVRILRTHPKASSGAAGLLESALTAYPERREVAQELTVRALAALSSIHIRDACTPNRNDSLTLESFIDEGGTLYVVGEAIEDPKSRPAAMPLLTALVSSVVEHGRRMAARSSDGRLDPPMTFVLDDVAAVAPLPELPGLLSTGQDQGLPALVLLRSQEQGRARWPGDHVFPPASTPPPNCRSV